MARFSTTSIRERLLAARGRGTESSGGVVSSQEATTEPTSVTYSQSDLAGIGTELARQKRFIVAQEGDVARARARLSRHESEGKDTAKDKEAVRREEAQLDELRAEYNSLAARLSPEVVSAARAAAPRRFKSGERQGSTPAENLQIRQEQRRSFTSARELATQAPGVYEFRGGGAFISTAQDGVFLNQRGETVEIRSPVGSKLGGGFLYNPSALKEPSASTRTVSGFNLFDVETREGVKAAASSGRFKTTGALYASAQMSVAPEMTFAQRYERGANWLRDRFPNSRVVSAGYAPSRALQLITNRTYERGVTVEQTGKYSSTRWLGGALAGASARFKDEPIYGASVVTAEVVTWYGGASVLKRGVTWVAPKLATRYGAVRTIAGFRRAQTVATVGGSAYAVFDLSTSNPQEAGSKLVSYAAAGAGLSAGLAGGPRLSPSVRVEPTRYVRATGSKLGVTPGDFSLSVRSPVTITESAYGITRTIQPSMRATLSSVRARGVDPLLGDVPVRLRGSVKYNSLLTGGEVTAPVDYAGIYRFGRFRAEPTILKTRIGGVEVSRRAVRVPPDTLVLTRGTGRSREVFISEVFSKSPYEVREPGTYDIAAPFRASTYRGSRTARLVDTAEGTIRLVGLEREQPIVNFAQRKISILEEYRSTTFKLGLTDYFVRPKQSTIGYFDFKTSDVKFNAGISDTVINRALVFPGATKRYAKRFNIKTSESSVGYHEVGHIVQRRAGIKDAQLVRAIRNIPRGEGMKLYNAKALESGDYYSRYEGNWWVSKEKIIASEIFADLYSFNRLNPGKLSKIAPKTSEMLGRLNKPIVITQEATVRTGLWKPEVGFPFRSQSFRTRAVAFERSEPSVVFPRPERDVAAYGILERYGRYRAPRRYEVALPPDNLVYSSPFPLTVRQVPSVAPEPTRPLLARRGLPLPQETVPLVALQGVTPMVSTRFVPSFALARSPRLTTEPQTSFSLSSVRVAVQEPQTTTRLRTETRLSLDTSRVTTTRLLVPELTTPGEPRTPFTPVYVPPFRPPTLNPPGAPFLPVFPIFGPGAGAPGRGSRRGYGLARTITEVELGLGGVNLNVAPRGGFSGLEVARSSSPRRRRRSRR